MDIGGGNGHAVKSISSAYDFPINQCVLQDMGSVIDEVVQSGDSQGLQLITIDLHQEQPVKGLFAGYSRLPFLPDDGLLMDRSFNLLSTAYLTRLW